MASVSADLIAAIGLMTDDELAECPWVAAQDTRDPAELADRLEAAAKKED